jgi:NitT/TauT family transport system substrate-binding protein
MKRGFIAGLVALSMLLTSVPAATAQEKKPVNLEVIKVGHIPIFGFAPFFVAVEKGYFKEQGLNVQLERFRSGGTMIAPLSTGHLDVGGGETGPALFNAVNQGLDVKVVAALAAQPHGFGAVPCLVRKVLHESGEITEPKDLAGKKIGINIARGTAEYLLAQLLAKVGLTVDDVKLVTLPFPEMPAALENGAIDGAILPHPLASKAIGTGAAVVLVDGDKITDFPQNGVLYFGRRLLENKNREAGIRFLVAYLRAARDLFGEGWRSDENAGILNKYTNVPIGAIKKGKAYYFDPDGRINLASTESFQDYHFKRGYTELKKPLPLSLVIDDSFREEALLRLGKCK